MDVRSCLIWSIGWWDSYRLCFKSQLKVPILVLESPAIWELRWVLASGSWKNGLQGGGVVRLPSKVYDAEETKTNGRKIIL